MKTTLSLSLVFFAALIPASAQTVYSANIVGYINVPIKPGYSSMENPFDAPGGNIATNIIANPSGIFDGCLVYVWSGSAYTIYTIDSNMSTGFSDSQDLVPEPPPVLNPGQMFYFGNTTANTPVNTFFGTVHIDGTGAGTVGLATNSLPPGYSFVASKIPIAGGVSSVLGLTNNAGTLDGDLIYIPNISVTGVFLGYNIVTFDSGMSTGFGNSSDTASAPEPVIPVGNGFIFLNSGATPVTWTESF